jgi:hypothetical protein
MSARAGWVMNPMHRSVLVPAKWLARQKQREYAAHVDARQALRERVEMIVTIDRAGTARSIAAESVGV